MADANQALLLQVSADLSKLTKAFEKASNDVDTHSTRMEKRATNLGQHIEKSLSGEGIEHSLKKVFDSSRLSVLEEGGAKLRVFGSALEPLGLAGITAAAGIVAVAVAVESVKKAMEEVGQLKVTADKLGLPVEALQELQFAAKESHVPVEALNGALAGLNDVLGRLKLNMGAARLQKLADVLGLSPADLAGVKTANDLLPILADHIKALPSLSEQYAAAAKANVAEILPLLLRGGDGVRELMAEYRSLGVEVGGNFADSVAKGNLEMEKAHDIAHDKLRNSLAELGPLIVGLSTAWDTFAAHAIDALNATTSAYDRFVQRATVLANKQAGPNDGFGGLGTFGQNLLGRFNLAVARPSTAISALFGNSTAQQQALYGVGPAASLAGPSPAAGTKPSTGPTRAQLDAELVAKEHLDALEAKYLTHTTNRLEAEKQIELINSKRAAAGDKPLDAATEKKILDAASAKDAAPANRAAETAQRKAEAAALKAKEKADRQEQAIDGAEKSELAARLALTTSVERAAKLRQEEVDQDTKKANDKADEQLNEGKINKATRDRLVDLNNIAAAEKKLLIAAQLQDAQAKTALDVAQASDDARLATLQAEQSMATTLAQRRDLELQILAIQQQEAKARIEAVLASKTATDAEKAVARAQLDALPETNSAQRSQVLHNTQGPISDYLDSIKDLNTLFKVDGVNAAKSLAQAMATSNGSLKSFGQSVLSTFLQLEQQIVQQLLEKSVTGPAVSGITSLISKLIPGFGFGGGSSAGTAFNFGGDVTIPNHFADGTDFAPGGWAEVGERGREVVRLPRGAQVIPNHVLQAMAGASGPANGVRGGDAYSFNFYGPVTDPRQVQLSAGQAASRFARVTAGGASRF